MRRSRMFEMPIFIKSTRLSSPGTVSQNFEFLSMFRKLLKRFIFRNEKTMLGGSLVTTAWCVLRFADGSCKYIE
jgi:hypothetical protein